MSSRCEWSSWTSSAAGSACGSPTIPRSRENRSRSSRRWAPATAGRRAGAAATATGAAAGVVAATATAAAHAAASSRIVLEQHTITTLDSGVKVVTERLPSVRSVAVGLWVRVGSRDEPYEQAGISHFLEHMLFKGTEELN